jgi:hypothetical protein
VSHHGQLCKSRLVQVLPALGPELLVLLLGPEPLVPGLL